MSAVVLLALLVSQTGVDGCTSCHASTATVAAHAALLPKHTQATCTACHRGDKNARDKAAAHAMGPEELLAKERTGAACVVCHVAGSVAGTEAIVSGGKIYLSRGCGFCHAGAMGLGYYGAFAPPLFAVGARGSQYLQNVIRNPKSVFPGTVMPAFKLPAAEERDLLAYLLSLRGDYIPPKRPALSKERCATCHIGQASPKKESLTNHRCGWIAEEKANLSCKRCHAQGVPASDRECLYIGERRKECGSCHEGGLDGR